MRLRAALLVAGATLLTGSATAEPVAAGQPIALPRYAEGVVLDRQERPFVSDPMSDAVFRLLDGVSIEVWARLDGADGHKVHARRHARPAVLPGSPDRANALHPRTRRLFGGRSTK